MNCSRQKDQRAARHGKEQPNPEQRERGPGNLAGRLVFEAAPQQSQADYQNRGEEQGKPSDMEQLQGGPNQMIRSP
jgi:hypothetical protein